MLKILIIEDDESTRLLLKRIFKKRYTCAVFEAENGEIGLNALQEYLPDLVLLDLTMPVMDGVETLEKIRSNSFFKNIPVLIITALNEKKLIGSLAEKGISDYILKPIDPDLAFKRIKNIVNTILANSNKSGKNENIYSVIGLKQILIVDKDVKFISFFSSVLGNNFIIHEASSGIEGLHLFIQHKPNYIFISDKFGMLDKKIMTEKVREVAEKNEISIYLLTENAKESSSRVFYFDGILNKTFDSVLFLKEFSKTVLMIVDPIEKIESILTSSLPYLQKLIQQTFFEFTKKEIKVIELPEFLNTDNFLCISSKLTDFEEGISLLVSICGAEKDIVSLTNEISINSNSSNILFNELFKNLFILQVEGICSLLSEKGYSFPNNQSIALESRKSFIDPDWNINIVLITKDQELFSFGLIFGNI